MDGVADAHDARTGRARSVTIGMPVWNAQGTLRESLDSVLAQDFPDFELVVSDNASTDATPEILAEYAARDDRVRVVRQAENIGGAANFSALVALARTPYFKWQSGDDLLLPTMLSRCVEVLDAQPEVVLAYAKTMMIDEDGHFFRNHEDRLHMRQPEAWRRMAHFARYRWLCNPQFGVIRTDVLRQTSLLTKKVHSDRTLLAQLALRGQFHEVPERLFVRRFAARSAGLGDLSKDEVAQWFDPKALRAPRVSPELRVFWDVQRSIVQAPLPLPERLAALAAYDVVHARRRANRWRYVWKLRRSGERDPGWAALREGAPAQDDAVVAPRAEAR